MCGICGIINKNNNVNITGVLYDCLFNLQHRGQESSGIITYSFINKKLYKSKNFGLVTTHIPHIYEFHGNMGLGHVRYPTNGENTKREIQPFFIPKPYGISLVHNGNIINKDALILFLEQNYIYVNSTSDSDVILNLFYFFIEKDITKLNDELIVKTVQKICDMCVGSYSIIIMINDYGLVAFRDKYGIRPLVYYNDDDNILFSSETIALRSINNNEKYCNVKNGEIVIASVLDCISNVDDNVDNVDNVGDDNSMNNINRTFNINKYMIDSSIKESMCKPCLFEYIYFARPESYINDILVHDFREKAGEKILEIIDKSVLKQIDLIVPVPQTSMISAIAISNKTKIPLKYAINKNRYTSRSFINKENDILKTIKKITVIKSAVEGKNILVVDDSIVRGNTSKYIIQELRKCNVGKIYFASCSPPIKYPNIYGIAIPSFNELIAYNKSIKEVEEYLDVDKLYYLPLEKMISALKGLNPRIYDYESSVFTGEYL